jgi:hypothetical protein
MSISVSSSAVHAPRNLPGHDPLVCGLGYDTDCPQCRACTDAKRRAEEKRDRRCRLRSESRRTRSKARQLARLMRLHRRLFSAAILDLREMRELIQYEIGRALAANNGRAVR